ncbi:hypothetical protein DPMN_028886 [Dreissena polymorpha]|uniref:Uncharacterized protein n=1 Tax=Dreissena polymorpha TaxID=45954 RepID=A0A9D4LY54_DREPO|nr:hypothetical protein DPMN_028886 [Dreissena polymorpha]
MNEVLPVWSSHATGPGIAPGSPKIEAIVPTTALSGQPRGTRNKDLRYTTSGNLVWVTNLLK